MIIGRYSYFIWYDNASEEEDIVAFFEEKNQSNRLILYACTSGYQFTLDVYIEILK